MKKRCKITTLVTMIALFVISIVSSLIVAGATALGTWGKIEMKPEYDFGTIFAVPQRTFTLSDETVNAVASLEKPDGTVTGESSVTLDQVGVYNLKYTAAVGGKNYVNEISFGVRYGLTSVGEKSSVSYGKDDYAESKEGLLVRLAKDDKLVFNDVIDMTKLTKNDTLIELFATPDAPGSRDFSGFTITFTDITNENNYLIIKMGDMDVLYPGQSSCSAGGNGQTVTSYMEEWKLMNEVRAKHSFKSADSNNIGFATDKYVVAFTLDQETMNVHVIDADRRRLVVGLANSDYQSVLWKGFESGKVRCSIEASGYSGMMANFCVSKLFGVDLTQKNASDAEGPVITTDFENEEVPVAVAGKQYKVPSASAYDVCTGAADVQTEVWFNYASENAVRIPVENGIFKTEYRGVYSIVYKAADQIGNTSEKVLKVKALSEINAITVDLGEDYATEAVLGQIVACPVPILAGGSGNKVYVVKAENGDEVLTTENHTFLFEKEGTWTITYTATDYIGNETVESYTIAVSRGNAPIFNEKPVLPEVFISGSAYVLPECYASDYTSGTLVKTLADVEINDADGTRTVKAGESFIPKVANNGDKVSVSYKCGDATPIVYEVPAVLVWVQDGRARLHLENYFYGNGIMATATDSSVDLTATSDGTSTVTFANTLIAQSLTLDLAAIPQKSQFDGVIVSLVDAKNPNISVSVRIMKSGLLSNVTVSGETTTLVFGFNALSATNKLSLGYSQGYVSLGATYKAAVSECDNGDTFSGFPSNSVYLKISLVNAQAGATLSVENVDGAPMSNTITDRIKPKIVALDTYGGTYVINSQVEIKPVFCSGDAADPNVKLSVTVTSPAGEIVKDVNGTLLSDVDPYRAYTITIEEYGQYLVKYTSSDTFNARPNTITFDYAINVFDAVAPTILFDARFVSEAKVGDVVVIPGFEVSDNQTPAEEILVITSVQNPNGVWIRLVDGSNSIKCEYVGTYVFTIMAQDAAGNTTLVKVGVVVK